MKNHLLTMQSFIPRLRTAALNRQATRLVATAICVLIFLAQFCLSAPGANDSSAPENDHAHVFDVRELGAKGDGKTMDTAAIQKALDDCGNAGGGIVRLPAGTYLSAPIFLRAKTTLLVDAGATLQASDNPQDYPPTTKQNLGKKSDQPLSLINAFNLTDVGIAGKGTIDGAGAKWWPAAREAKDAGKPEPRSRPHLIRLIQCKRVHIEDITLANSPKFHLVPMNCEDLVIKNITIQAPADSPNTDGIDPSMCRRVQITGCHIDTGDDNIALKSGHADPAHPAACEDITVSDCTFLHGHGMSIGSETAGGVRNLTVEHCTFEGTENGIRIKSPRGKGGLVENIIYRDLTMKNVDPAIKFTCYYEDISKAWEATKGPQIPQEDPAQPVTATTPIFRNIRVINLTATCARSAGIIIGLPESLVSDVVIENVHITADTGLKIKNARGIQLKNVTIDVKHGPAIIPENAEVQGMETAAEKP